MNIDTPIAKQAYELCLAIEALPASEQATQLVTQASALGEAVSTLEHQKGNVLQPCRSGLLQHAASEIRSLRRVIELLRAKEEVLNIFAHASGMRLHEGPMGASEDIAWALDRAAEEEKQREKKHQTEVEPD